MLLDLELKIIVTNDGNNNSIALTVDQNTKFQHATTAVEMVSNMLSNAFENYLKKKIDSTKVDEEFVKNEFTTVTFHDLSI